MNGLVISFVSSLKIKSSTKDFEITTVPIVGTGCMNKVLKSVVSSSRTLEKLATYLENPNLTMHTSVDRYSVP